MVKHRPHLSVKEGPLSTSNVTNISHNDWKNYKKNPTNKQTKTKKPKQMHDWQMPQWKRAIKDRKPSIFYRFFFLINKLNSFEQMECQMAQREHTSF